MEIAFRYLAPASPCGYLPAETWQLQYEVVASISRREYLQRMTEGWRRFGVMLFRPRCPACTACRSLRVLAGQFRPDRSQRRVRAANAGTVRLHIGRPAVTRPKLDLYDRYHAFQSSTKGWPEHAPKDAREYARSFVDNPFPTQEWAYYLGDRLIGLGYVDDLDTALSAIYFFYDPAERHRSPGVWNVLSLIDHAARRGVPHVYLGYHVAGCASMAYKARYRPNQVLDPDGEWRDFLA
jgi:arginine-tRNA-protein transferase